MISTSDFFELILFKKDNMKVIRARDKALELERQLEEAAEYQRILDEGGNADQQLNIKKRLNDQAEKKK